MFTAYPIFCVSISRRQLIIRQFRKTCAHFSLFVHCIRRSVELGVFFSCWRDRSPTHQNSGSLMCRRRITIVTCCHSGFARRVNENSAGECVTDVTCAMACNSDRNSVAWPAEEEGQSNHQHHYDDHDLLAFDGIPLTVLEHFSWTPAESEARARRRKTKQRHSRKSSSTSSCCCYVISQL